MSFIRRFTINPGDAILNNVPSINIIDQAPQGVIKGIIQNVVGIVGEFVKGPYATPTAEGSYSSVVNDFGGFNAGVGEGDLSANGNGVAQLSGLTWGGLVVVRADLHTGNVTFTLSGTTSTPILIPAGSRVKSSGAPTHIFLTDQDLTIPGTTGNLTGTVGIVPLNAASFGIDAIAAIDTVVDKPSGLGTVTISCSNAAATTDLTAALVVTAYQNAITSTLVYNGSPGSTINILFSARKDPLSAQPITSTGTVEPIRAALISNAVNFSNNNVLGRLAVCIGHRGTVKAQALNCKLSSQAVYGLTDEREIFEDLAVKWNSPEAGSMLEICSDAFMASVLSQLPPWENPGQATQYTAGILGLESDLTESYGVQDYIDFVAAGINAFQMDPLTGPQFIQGFTGVNQAVYSANRRVSRRRMADYIEASIALGTASYSKKLSTPVRRDTLTGEIVTFLNGELSKSQPENAHIASFSVDDQSGNTQAQLDSGEFNVLVSAKTLPSMDAINFIMTVGENITISEPV